MNARVGGQEQRRAGANQIPAIEIDGREVPTHSRLDALEHRVQPALSERKNNGARALARQQLKRRLRYRVRTSYVHVLNQIATRFYGDPQSLHRRGMRLRSHARRVSFCDDARLHSGREHQERGGLRASVLARSESLTKSMPLATYMRISAATLIRCHPGQVRPHVLDPPSS